MTTTTTSISSLVSTEELREAHATLSGFIEHLDARDQDILARCFAARQKLTEPCMGDFVLFPTGELERFSNNWGDRLQTSPRGGFYLDRSGHGSLSCGALNPSTPKDLLMRTDARLPGDFWFFHNDIAGAGRGVYFKIPCRVFITTAQYTGFLGRTLACPSLLALTEELRRSVATTSPPEA